MTDMDKNNFFKEKNILVLGLGRSGLCVLDKLALISNSIIAFDNKPDFILPDNLKSLQKCRKIKFFKGSAQDLITGFPDDIDLAVISPGISMKTPLIKKILQKKIKVWSELELSWFFMDEIQRRKTIAVTGTNGKTTVTSLIGKILNDCGFKAQTCGNIGNPLLDTLQMNGYVSSKNLNEQSDNTDFIRVIEVSSFQLENTFSFNPHVAVILNITNDHVDRHGTMKIYTELKFKIAKNQDKHDYLFVNSDDRYTAGFLKKTKFKESGGEIKSNLIRFSLNAKNNTEIYYKDGYIIYNFNNLSGKLSVKDINLIGSHNISNIMGAVGAVKIFKADDLCIGNSIKNFTPLPHRLEYVGIIRGIKCFNDSKATNPDATIRALQYFRKEVTLILGGLDKGMNFKGMVPVLDKKVRNLILIGSCRELLFEIFSRAGSDYRIFKALTLDEAVQKAFEVTEKGNVFLLSPACASMDMFKDYKDRGEKFKKLVLSYK
ncbi:MAG: UDP-N-acetylmuramoyl-L-alanine--D-glutamate ligase [Cyanobacteria bacterium]|nr:UDP-N-acetylmuramoyl-L-alanine--D-glutamate ligase [Cyanobacteriota bacterium]